jgi:hypothetical protein
MDIGRAKSRSQSFVKGLVLPVTILYDAFHVRFDPRQRADQSLFAQGGS